MGSYEGAFSAEPAAGDHPRGDWGDPWVAPVVGSRPPHPVMPNLVMLWKMSPLRGGMRAGARLWARGPARRGWVAIEPKPKPRGAGGAPGPLRGEARRPARATFLSPIISGVRELQQAFAALRASSICAVVIFGISTKVGRPCVGAKTAVADRSTGGKKSGNVHLVLWRTHRCIGSLLCIKTVM
jgi:hypothetical protein